MIPKMRMDKDAPLLPFILQVGTSKSSNRAVNDVRCFLHLKIVSILC